MCSSLASFGYDVSLVVADGRGDEFINSVSIYDVNKTIGGRLSRMTRTVIRVFKKARELNADVYHLHDPELMLAGLILKKMGKTVIFDSHEDFPKQILSKPYLNRPLKLILSKTYDILEKSLCPKFDAIIAATPLIRDKFLNINKNSVDINNFPLLNELKNTADWKKKENEVSYVGSIAKVRGIKEIIKGMSFTCGVRLNLAGEFTDETFREDVKAQKAWPKVNELGFLDRDQIKILLAHSRAGLVTLQPVKNYIDALPVKMFEYMAAGIPVIASDFPLWREIVLGNQCGICINPKDPKDIGEAIQYLIDHPDEAEKLGKNGRLAVEKKYNWSSEELKLITLYQRTKKN